MEGGPPGLLAELPQLPILRDVEKNRERQRERNYRRTGQSRPIAKMDASLEESRIIPGRYKLVPLDLRGVAKTDAINVEIRVIQRC